MSDRYYMMPMLDGWTNVFQSPGTRTTGTKAQKYAITGPGHASMNGGFVPPGKPRQSFGGLPEPPNAALQGQSH
jgi:hypothetical protein